MSSHNLVALSREYSDAMAAGDVPRAGRVIGAIINAIKNMKPETARAAVEFLKAILGEFGLNLGEASTLSTPLSADQLLQPGVLPAELNELAALHAREDAEDTHAKQDAGEHEEETAGRSHRGRHKQDEDAEGNPVTAKAALGTYAELIMLLFQFIRQIRAQQG